VLPEGGAVLPEGGVMPERVATPTDSVRQRAAARPGEDPRQRAAVPPWTEERGSPRPSDEGRAARKAARRRETSTSRRRKDNTERLLSAAEQLFGELSYQRASVAGICARAGIATGSFYAHFGSKADIFAAVVRRINADLRAAMRVALENAAGDQRARERACFRAFFEMLSQRPWIDRIVRESEFVDPGLFREYYERLARGYARGVRQAQLVGEVDARYDPEVIAYLYTGAGNFIGMRWADWAGRQVPDDVLEDLLEVLARGLPPRAST
jgi:AcrR family transcriptional regulator